LVAGCGSSGGGSDASDGKPADGATADVKADTAAPDVATDLAASETASDVNNAADVATDTSNNDAGTDAKADASSDVTADVATAEVAAETGADVSASETAADVKADTAADVSASETATDVSAAETAMDTSGLCATFANAAPVVQIVKLAETAPAPAGGTIVDGLYSVVSMITYTGAGGEASSTAGAFRQTEQFLNGTWNGVLNLVAGGDPLTFATNYTVAASGKTINITKTCGNPNPTMLDFTATATEVRFLTATSAIVLQKQ
jgi:hypothetical protein